jgi:hypothetical protein
VLEKQLRDDWHARERAVPIQPIMTFAPEGLVLGAGTILIPSEGPRRLRSLQGRQAHILALLSAAYGRSIAPSVLGNIERAVKSWRDGDECLAYIHLAHSRLQVPSDVRTAAYRLFVAEHAMKAGVRTSAVFQALNIDRSYIDAVEKAYNPAQPRVPAGSGRTSGEWTDSEQTSGAAAATEAGARDKVTGSSLARAPLPAASFLGELTAAQLLELGAYASRLLGPAGAAVAVFGLLFVPSSNNVRVEGRVPEIPGLRYSWNRDETLLHLTYDDSGGRQRTFSASLDGDVFRDVQGRVIGRVLTGGNIAIDAAAVSRDLLKEDEPRLCPDEVPDKPGSTRGKKYEQNRAKRYEDYVKRLINPPPNTTPSGYVYELPNPRQNGKMVTYDDCKKTALLLAEIKGPGYAKLLRDDWGKRSISEQWLDQSGRQLAARGLYPLRWYFAEKEAADFARKLFLTAGGGRDTIDIQVEPWSEDLQ